MRLSDPPDQIEAIFRLDTPFGSSGSQALIAFEHGTRGLSGVANAYQFLDASLRRRYALPPLMAKMPIRSMGTE